ncbi:MAG: winged helix-turn-helix transcriptional regulator [Candidatus Levybacteria bacterium]|nr:winged helix-turn-helix transcriptional regulator [Candidatus Levybacteria bacterium]MBP9814810.1 winged helix-turn-helix transcriptional regulator [Candidatus Levybacteria bacterium]
MLTPNTIETIIKSFSNHSRIEILEILEAYPYISLEEISIKTNTNYKTASEHVRRLTASGLIKKQSYKTSKRHSLNQRGKFILKFLRTLE